MIYLDNAATTLQKPQAVYDAVYDAMKTLGNSGRGFSGAALGASRMIYEARQTLCDFFGGSDPSRLVFTSNGSFEYGNPGDVSSGRSCDHDAAGA